MDAPAGYQIVERSPTVAEYRAIVAAVGWEPFLNMGAVEAALAGSLHHVVALHDGEAVGMGRLVGDGAMYFYIQDVAVMPGHQRHGLGRRIVGRLLDHVRQQATGPAFVGL